MRAGAQAVDLLNPPEAVTLRPVDANPVPAGVLHGEDLAVRSDRVRAGKRVVERAPTADVRIERAAPDDAMVPAIDDEVIRPQLFDGRRREQMGSPCLSGGRRPRRGVGGKQHGQDQRGRHDGNSPLRKRDEAN